VQNLCKCEWPLLKYTHTGVYWNPYAGTRTRTRTNVNAPLHLISYDIVAHVKTFQGTKLPLFNQSLISEMQKNITKTAQNKQLQSHLSG